MPRPSPVCLFGHCLSCWEPPARSHLSLPWQPTSRDRSCTVKTQPSPLRSEKLQLRSAWSRARLSAGLHRSWTSPLALSHSSPSLPRCWPQGQSSVSSLYENFVSGYASWWPQLAAGLCAVWELGEWRHDKREVRAVYTRGSPYRLSPPDKSCAFHLACSAIHVKTYFLMHVINRWSCITWQTVGKSFQNITAVKLFLYRRGWLWGFKEWVSRDAASPSPSREPMACSALRAPARSGFLFGPLPCGVLRHSFQSALSSHRACRLIPFWAAP